MRTYEKPHTVLFTSYQRSQNVPPFFASNFVYAGRCSLFPDLNVITFDGNSVAIYKAASYVVTKLPNETVTVLVQECPADAESTVSQTLGHPTVSHSFFICILRCAFFPPKLFWNFTNLCLVALNITHKSNHVTINRLQRRVSPTPFLSPVLSICF